MWLFKFKFIKIKVKTSSLVTLATVQHISIDIEHVSCHRKFCWTLLVKNQVATLGGRIECGLLFLYPVSNKQLLCRCISLFSNCSNAKVKFTEVFFFDKSLVIYMSPNNIRTQFYSGFLGYLMLKFTF